MIIIERLNAQIQVDGLSHAIVASRPRNTNPMLIVTPAGSDFNFTFTGLQIGDIERVDGAPRQNHFDFYIGMDDLVAYRGVFPPAVAAPMALAAAGLRNPAARVRAGGKAIRWRGAIARLNFDGLKIMIPPYRVVESNEEPKVLNVDKESSPYPIDNGNGRTTRELHIGFENPFVIRANNRIKIPRIVATLSGQQYATVLAAIDEAIAQHV